LFVAPTLLFLVALAIYPLFYAGWLSFRLELLFNPAVGRYVGLDNYATIFEDPLVVKSLLLTGFWTVLALVFQIVVGFLIAMALDTDIRGNGIMRTLFIVPVFISPIAIGLTWRFMFEPVSGVINWALRSVGLPSSLWLSSPDTALYSILITDTWQWTPFVALILHRRLDPDFRSFLHHDAGRTGLVDPGRQRLQLHHVPDRPHQRHGDVRDPHPHRYQRRGHPVRPAARTAGALEPKPPAARSPMRSPGRIFRDVVAVTVVAVWLMPVLWIALTSIKPTTAINSRVPVFWSFAPTTSHYLELFERFEFARILKNSLVIVPSATLVTMILAVFSAYALSRMPLRGSDNIAFFILSLRFMPGVVIVLPYYLMFQEIDVLDSYFGMILVYVAFGLPFAVFLLRSFLIEIPKDIEEAARLDGLGYFSIIWRIVLPIARPGIAVATIFTFVFSWNEYLFALALTFDHAVTLPVQISKMIDAYSVLWGQLSAAVMLQLLPMVAVVFMLQRHIVRGLALGAVK
jgi:multiple sugar transport system permease protein